MVERVKSLPDSLKGPEGSLHSSQEYEHLVVGQQVPGAATVKQHK